MKATTLPTGTVLDEPMAHALLFAAVRERLLDDNPVVGDGFVRRILSSPPSRDLVENAFEHLVISGRVYVPFWLPSDWRGALLEEGIVVQTDPGLEDDLVEAPGLSPSLALAMLRDRGQVWTHDDLLRRYRTFMDTYRTWEATGGRSFEGMEIRMVLRQVVPIEPEEFSEEQLAAWKAVSTAYDALKPVLACHKAYRHVLTSALQHGALSALPLDVATIPAGELPLVETATDRTTLLGVACRGLRRAPIGATLRDTLDLARSPEAQDLRHRLAEWTEVIRTNDADPVEMVLQEVERARHSLATAKAVSRVGEYCTIIGVPSSLAGLFLAGPLVVISGLAISAIGGVALGGQKYIEHMNRWAMFGQN